MSKVTKTFTFKVPDDYTLQEAENDSSVSFTYHGPHYLKVEIDRNNHYLNTDEITLEDWTLERAENPEENAVLINALAQPLEASIFWAMKDSDVADLPTRTKTGPDGLEYTYPWPLTPHRSYLRDDMTWNPDTLAWNKPYPFKRSWMTWEGITVQANSIQTKAQSWLDADSGGDSDLTAAWTKIRDEAANKVNAWSSAGFLPHEVQFRLSPEDSDAQVELANRPAEEEDSA
jgi:hypothetical protein